MAAADRVLARLTERRCWAILGGAAVVYAVLFFWFARDTRLFLDEAQYFVQHQGLDLESLLTPVNGHLVFLWRLLQGVALELQGPEMTLVRVANIAGHLAVVAMVFWLVNRRLGPVVALALASLLLFLGSTWEITFTQSGITYIYSVAFGLGALLALERDGRRAGPVACVLLSLSVLMFTFGLAFVLGAAVMVGLRPDWRRRAWVVLTPAAIYGAWLLWAQIADPAGGDTHQLAFENILNLPSFMAQESAAVAGAVSGLDRPLQPNRLLGAFQTGPPVFGPVLAIGAAIALGFAIARRGASALLLAALLSLLAIWAELGMGVGLGRNPETVRYVYPGAVLAMVIGAEAAGTRRLRTGVVLAVIAAVVVALFGNLSRLREGIDLYRTFTLDLRAQQAALELAGDNVVPGYRPSGGSAGFANVDPTAYLPAVDRNGSPALPLEQLAEQDEPIRADADGVLVGALGLALTPAAAADAATTCRTLTGAPDSPLEVRFVEPGIVLGPGTGTVSIRRFADDTATSIGDLDPRASSSVRVPEDASDRPWVVEVAAPEPVRVCQLAG